MSAIQTTTTGSSTKALKRMENSIQQVDGILLEQFPATARLTTRRVQSMQDLSSYNSNALHHSSVLDADVQKSYELRREKIQELRGARRRRSMEMQRIMDGIGLSVVKEQHPQQQQPTTLSQKFLSVQDLRSAVQPSSKEERTTTTEGKPFHSNAPPLSMEELKNDLERRRKQRLELQSKVRRRSSSISSTNSESCNVIVEEEEESSALYF
mmetsp:Transcript_11528/g.16562  ORF Transcript_11528/g.16562 Transcript_11528/m.16562 type:complete len:211 (-) Transcript_11528:140-772(-)